MPLSDRKLADPLSKSQLKREMQALRDMGATLVDLNEAQLAIIIMPDDLREAILFCKSITAHEARRRQLQWIGKLMRHVDLEPIQAALRVLKLQVKKSQAQFNQVEHWRERLIEEGDDALQAFVESFAQADRQELRQLVRRAQQDRLKNKNTGAGSVLFKYLRDLVK